MIRSQQSSAPCCNYCRLTGFEAPVAWAPSPGRRDRGRGDYVAAAASGFRWKGPALSADTDLNRVHHQWIIQPLDEGL
jgi:hypothetical protein